MKRIGKALLSLIGALLMLAGAFFVVAGAWDGFGDPAILSRLLWIGAGLAGLAIGFYLVYLAKDRDPASAIDSIIDGILFNLWR